MNPEPLTLHHQPEVNPEPLTLHHQPEVNPEPLTGIYAITLTAPDGRQRNVLAYLPTPETLRNFFTAAKRNKLTVTTAPVALASGHNTTEP